MYKQYLQCVVYCCCVLLSSTLVYCSLSEAGEVFRGGLTHTHTLTNTHTQRPLLAIDPSFPSYSFIYRIPFMELLIHKVK